MNCLECGVKLPDGARFCFSCGAQVGQPVDVDALYVKLQASAEQKNWKEVVEFGEKLLRVQPEHSEARKHLIIAYLEPSLAGEDVDIPTILQQCDKALALDPSCVDAWVQKGLWSNIQFHPGEDFAMSLRRGLVCIDRAIGVMNTQIDRNRWDARLYVQRGKVYIQRGNILQRRDIVMKNSGTISVDYDLALADFEQAIGLAPESAEAYLERGSLFKSNLHEPDKAVADFLKALDLQVENPGYTYALRGATYLALGRIQEAAEDIEQAISAGETSAYLIRGDIVLKRGDWRSALRDYSLYITRDLNGNWDTGVFILKKVLKYLAETGMKDETLSTALSIAPNIQNVHLLHILLAEIEPLIIAEILQKGGDDINLNFRSPWFDILLRLSNSSPHNHILIAIRDSNYKLYRAWLDEISFRGYAWALELRADEYSKERAFRNAAADYQRALGLGEKKSELYEKLAECYEEMGDHEEQVGILSVALEHILDKSQRAEQLSKRAWAYKKLKEYSLAIDDLTEGIHLAPTHWGKVYWLRDRGDSYIQMGNLDAAAADYERALRLVEPDQEWLRGVLEERLYKVKESG